MRHVERWVLFTTDRQIDKQTSMMETAEKVVPRSMPTDRPVGAAAAADGERASVAANGRGARATTVGAVACTACALGVCCRRRRSRDFFRMDLVVFFSGLAGSSSSVSLKSSPSSSSSPLKSNILLSAACSLYALAGSPACFQNDRSCASLRYVTPSSLLPLVVGEAWRGVENDHDGGNFEVKNGEQVGSCHMKHEKSKRTSRYGKRLPTAAGAIDFLWPRIRGGEWRILVGLGYLFGGVLGG